MSVVLERKSELGDAPIVVVSDVEHAGGEDEVKDTAKSRVERRRSWTRWESGPSQEGTTLRLFAHNFFSEEVSACRRAYLKLVLRATILTIILTWACLPIYWGSLSASAELTGNLEAWVINRDEGRIGESFVSAVIAAPTKGPGALLWTPINASIAGDDETIAQAVINEQTWLAVRLVTKNASTRLSAARASGDVTYDPTSVFTVYYAQARNDVATGNFLLPAATAMLSNFTSTYATASTQRFLATIVAQNGSVNITALNGIAQAPQTISPGIGYRLVNLRPYTSPVSQAVLLVGNIYLCIFTFMLAMAHSSARAYVEQHLTFSSYLSIRIATPLLLYIPLSLSYAMVSLAFRLPFGARYTYGTGFVAFFAYIYLGMCGLGLALEAMITVLTPRFVPFFLVLLIIVNISTVSLPPDLQPNIYTYGIGFPFWNIQQAIRTILFDTASHLPQNAGVLIAWVLLSCGTLSTFTWLLHVRDLRRTHRARLATSIEGGEGPCAFCDMREDDPTQFSPWVCLPAASAKASRSR
ncbi:hypothetical protein M0805_007655 [Coniferiporia weirii]|nr:hypothetical protein M0805_007655 [Coniferiporia weirii]